MGVMMPAFEIPFEVTSFTDDQVVEVQKQMDVIASEGHGRCTMTILVEASDVAGAFQLARAALHRAGVTINRLAPDFVNRAEIARRARVSTQAVGQYVRGERRSTFTFPTPAGHAPEPIWIWGDVAAWLQDQRIIEPDDVRELTQEDFDHLQYRLRNDDRTEAGWIDVSTRAAVPVPTVEPDDVRQMVHRYAKSKSWAGGRPARSAL